MGQVADAKHDQLRMVLVRENSRAKQFLSDLRKQCGGNKAPLNQGCATHLIKGYLSFEGALGASLYHKDGRLTVGITSSRQPENSPFKVGQLAAFNHIGRASNHAYFINVTDESTGYGLEVTYPAAMLESIFIPYPAGLGQSGETFLADGEGYFATPPRYQSTQGQALPITAHPMQACLSAHSHEMLDLDYRDVAIIHGFRFIPELGSACIMAHISQEEAFAPLRLLQQTLLIGLLLTVSVLTFVAFYIAKRIVRPVTNLTQVARAISAGDYMTQAEVVGNDEISALSSAFNEMTQRLHDSRDELGYLLNSMVEGAYGVDFNGNGTFVNQAFLNILGYPHEQEVLGKNMHALIHHSHADGSPYPVSECKIYRAHQINQTVNVADEVFWRKDGVAIPVEYWSHPVEADGVVTGSIVTFVNITDRKKTEDELRIAAVAFESQESLIITDANSVILHVNQAFVDETGYTAAEIIGQTPRLFVSGRHDADFYQTMWDTINSTGKWQGEIWDRRKNGEVYPKWLTISAVKARTGGVTHYVGSHIDITERKAAEEKIQYLAFYDYLTRLPNRRLLVDRLKQALVSSARSGRAGALLFIDLDNFKTLNDLFGHDVGDLLLQHVAQRLESTVREGDTVARLGGDEFVVMLEGLSAHPIEAAEQAEMVGEKMLAALNQPYQLAAQECHSTPSMGITLFGNQKEGVDGLLKQADIALYQAKKAGRNTLRFFDLQVQETINTRAMLEGELRNALEKQQFHLYYQIQVDDQQRPLGAETLIRWIHPERGMVSPMQFIPLAEETGLILPIGQWVLEAACAQIKAWSHHADTRDLVLAVNVSAKQFNQAGFVAQVQTAVQQQGIDPTRLKLELTESMLVESIEEIISSMQALKKMGVQFSLDDFGTGYSSLQYLQRLPLDQLKIDQSFVRTLSPDLNGNAIVRAIIAMAKGMNLDVIAEGVETEAQRQLLHYFGCAHYQGYWFGKPVPIAQFEAQLKTESEKRAK